jgi:plastocyanin
MDLTINEAGRYLVICAIRSHFLDKDPASNGGLFGFVEVGKPLEGETPANLAAALGDTAAATVRFGDPRFMGSNDLRNNNMVPLAVEVKAGAMVRFEQYGGHEVAVYKVAPETTRQAVAANRGAFVDTTINGSFDNREIGDAKNRIIMGASYRTQNRMVVNRDDATRMDLAITQPGRYLAICYNRSHYLENDPAANGGMFGFIDVR